jgi:hypothetical protein
VYVSRLDVNQVLFGVLRYKGARHPDTSPFLPAPVRVEHGVEIRVFSGRSGDIEATSRVSEMRVLFMSFQARDISALTVH